MMQTAIKHQRPPQAQPADFEFIKARLRTATGNKGAYGWYKKEFEKLVQEGRTQGWDKVRNRMHSMYNEIFGADVEQDDLGWTVMADGKPTSVVRAQGSLFNSPVNYTDPMGLRAQTAEDKKKIAELQQQIDQLTNEWKTQRTITYTQRDKVFVDENKPWWDTSSLGFHYEWKDTTVITSAPSEYIRVKGVLAQNLNSYVAAVENAGPSDEIFYNYETQSYDYFTPHPTIGKWIATGTLILDVASVTVGPTVAARFQQPFRVVSDLEASGGFKGQLPTNDIWEWKFPHGNTAGDQTAYLYKLTDLQGNLLKWGISQNPATRYSRSFMADKQMKIIQSGPRNEILELERELVETNPGPYNKEPWAGARKK